MGAGPGPYSVTDRLISMFPGLTANSYRETSPATYDYNCIAWAASRTNEWWEPSPDGFWPQGAPRQYTLKAYADAYTTLGYQPCPSGDFELGFQKIVLFTDNRGIPTHAARQLESGKWTSKLGPDVDIEHATPAALSGQCYGLPALFMRRARPIWRWPIVAVRRIHALVYTFLRGRR